MVPPPGFGPPPASVSGASSLGSLSTPSTSLHTSLDGGFAPVGAAAAAALGGAPVGPAVAAAEAYSAFGRLRGSGLFSGGEGAPLAPASIPSVGSGLDLLPSVQDLVGGGTGSEVSRGRSYSTSASTGVSELGLRAGDWGVEAA